MAESPLGGYRTRMQLRTSSLAPSPNSTPRRAPQPAPIGNTYSSGGTDFQQSLDALRQPPASVYSSPSAGFSPRALASPRSNFAARSSPRPTSS